MTGLLTDLAHKTCLTIAAAVAGTTTERLQHLLTDADWEVQALDRRRVAQLVARDPPDGLLAIDDTTFPKQGRASVGVARQYCGELGKVANCQTIVTAHSIADDLTSQTPLHWPVTARLFVPNGWLDDAERRKQAHIPDDMKAQTKHDLALDLIDRARTWKVPFRVVLADAGYGRVASFIQGLEERHLLYVCGVDKAFGVRRPQDVQAVDPVPPPPMGKMGCPRKAHPAALHLAHKLIAELPPTAWQTVAWREGSKGIMQKQFVAVQMHMATGEAGQGLDDPRV